MRIITVIHMAILGTTLLHITVPTIQAAGWDLNTRASNRGSITNTRHNLTMSYLISNSDSPSQDNVMN